jgi:hypothetical protein
MTSVKVVLTYEDYAALPTDGKRYEILDGELSVSAAPGRTHQHLVLRLAPRWMRTSPPTGWVRDRGALAVHDT